MDNYGREFAHGYLAMLAVDSDHLADRQLVSRRDDELGDSFFARSTLRSRD